MYKNFASIHKLSVILLCLVAAACASTSITERWIEADVSGGYQHPLIIGISDSQQTRRIYENHFVSELAKRKISATPSYSLISSKQEINRENVVKAIQGSDIYSVLVTYLISEDTQLRVHDSPLNTSYSGNPDDNLISATLVTNRGRPSSSEVIGLKTDLYDVERKAMIWSVKTRSVAPESIDYTVVEVTRLLIKQLRSDRMFN